MSYLLQSQIQESCRLALPNGLKELMSDISREVLRAQPPNIYDFITKYLAALLVTRENISIGCRLCQDICDSCCHPELEGELKNIGLDEANAATARGFIEKYFRMGKVDEGNLMMKLMRKTSISKYQLDLVQNVVHNAFLQHQINRTDDHAIHEMSSVTDDVSRAALHTLQLYAETGPSEEEYNRQASSIQAAYRSYGVQRLCKSKTAQDKKEKCSHLSAQSSLSAKDDISSDLSPISTSKSSSLFYYDPAKFKETDESSSQINLPELSDPENTKPSINYHKKRELSCLSEHNKLRFSETKEIINMSPIEDTPSFEGTKECPSSLASVMQYEQSHGDTHDEDEISSLFEFNFREFNEKSSNEAVYGADSILTHITSSMYSK